MDRTESTRDRGPRCSCCLPEVIPEEVQGSLDRLGGVDALPGLLPDAGRIAERVSAHGAMADPLRLSVLHLLDISQLCVCVIRSVTRVEDSKLSYHLGVLRGAGLVESRKEGSWVIYSITGRGRRWLSACSDDGV